MALLSDSVRRRILDVLLTSCSHNPSQELNELVAPIISEEEVLGITQRVSPLIGIQLDLLRIPERILIGFEPSQIGTIVGTLMDAYIHQLDLIIPSGHPASTVGLFKHEGILGEREGYPDYKFQDETRVELKLLYIDPVDVEMKKPPTPREPSARLTQKVTFKNVDPSKDVMLVLGYQLQENRATPGSFSPTICKVGIFPVVRCIIARDMRMYLAGGRWFGDFETPTVPSRIGARKVEESAPLDFGSYGRKESEGKDFNEDTNFGKLKRIPYKPLQEFLRDCGCDYLSSGSYPSSWHL